MHAQIHAPVTRHKRSQLVPPWSRTFWPTPTDATHTKGTRYRRGWNLQPRMSRAFVHTFYRHAVCVLRPAERELRAAGSSANSKVQLSNRERSVSSGVGSVVGSVAGSRARGKGSSIDTHSKRYRNQQQQSTSKTSATRGPMADPKPLTSPPSLRPAS